MGKLAKILSGAQAIKRGFDTFVDVPFEIINKSDVSISNINLKMNENQPFDIPSSLHEFEITTFILGFLFINKVLLGQLRAHPPAITKFSGLY